MGKVFIEGGGGVERDGGEGQLQKSGPAFTGPPVIEKEEGVVRLQEVSAGQVAPGVATGWGKEILAAASGCGFGEKEQSVAQVPGGLELP